MGDMRSTVDIYVKEIESRYYGLAFIEERILSTTVRLTREEAVRNLVGSIPAGIEHRVVEEGSEFADRTILMLKHLESGDESFKNFSLATQFMSEVSSKVLEVAALIPIGYVTSYGNIAKVAGTEAQTVGEIMAMNPVYPIVPCHRVVGSDFSLVGYGGSRAASALQAKLARLNKEERGFVEEKEIVIKDGKLTVYPVEYVTKKARKNDTYASGQRRIFDYMKLCDNV